jgi:hypothetical protein
MFALRKPSFINTFAAVCLFALTPLIFVLSQSDIANISRLLFSFEYWLFVFFYIGVYFLLGNVIGHKFYAVKSGSVFYFISSAVNHYLACKTI